MRNRFKSTLDYSSRKKKLPWCWQKKETLIVFSSPGYLLLLQRTIVVLRFKMRGKIEGFLFSSHWIDELKLMTLEAYYGSNKSLFKENPFLEVFVLSKVTQTFCRRLHPDRRAKCRNATRWKRPALRSEKWTVSV